ncbi:hypothetical protein AX16_007399 [Volvariella volvacea WC 439]|nr:hypothetical protein AX16_007399 [Volvariella volvacea WC 439]
MDLPPTFNHLHEKQRARLIRSTRKLGDILGTTVALQDTTTPRVPSSKTTHADPSDWVFVSLPNTGSRSSSLDSERSFESSKSSKPQPLYLRLEPRNATHHRHHSLPDSPLSPASPPPLSPPPSNPPSRRSISLRQKPHPSGLDLDLEAKRRKLAKLQRTFGENIPPELVFGTPCHSPAPPRTPTTPTHKHSQSHAVATTTGRVAHPGPRRGRSMSVSCTTTEYPYPTPPLPTKPLHTGDAMAIKQSSRTWPPVQVHITTSSHSTIPHPDAQSSLHQVYGHHLRPEVLESAEWGKRKEREWSGEWNLRDIEDVCKRLRELKSR